MSHYYINDSKLDHVIKSYNVQIKDMSFQFLTDRGVFSRGSLDFGTRLLLETVELDQQSATIIDMGCGYGPIGLYVAKMYSDKQVYLYDVNQRALDLAKQNQLKNNIENATIQNSYLFESVDFSADIVLTNPPIRAGKKVIYQLYEQAYKNLNEGGLLYVVIQKKQGAQSSINKLQQVFNNCETINKKKGYWVLLAKK